MTEPYLILHKVRGQPAFDVAERMSTPEIVYPPEGSGMPEDMWIISTSGHRAYPCWFQPLGEIVQNDVYFGAVIDKNILPESLPDHYHASEPPPSRSRHTAPSTTTEDFLL